MKYNKENTSVIPIIRTFTSLNLHICIPKAKKKNQSVFECFLTAQGQLKSRRQQVQRAKNHQGVSMQVMLLDQ